MILSKFPVPSPPPLPYPPIPVPPPPPLPTPSSPSHPRVPGYKCTLIPGIEKCIRVDFLPGAGVEYPGRDTIHQAGPGCNTSAELLKHERVRICSNPLST